MNVEAQSTEAGPEAREQSEQPALPLRVALRISERRLLLAGLDLPALNVALLLALGLRPGYSVGLGPVAEHPLWFVLLSLLWLPLAYAFDAYDLRECLGRNGREHVVQHYTQQVVARQYHELLTSLVGQA